MFCIGGEDKARTLKFIKDNQIRDDRILVSVNSYKKDDMLDFVKKYCIDAITDIESLARAIRKTEFIMHNKSIYHIRDVLIIFVQQFIKQLSKKHTLSNMDTFKQDLNESVSGSKVFSDLVKK